MRAECNWLNVPEACILKNVKIIVIKEKEHFLMILNTLLISSFLSTWVGRAWLLSHSVSVSTVQPMVSLS